MKKHIKHSKKESPESSAEQKSAARRSKEGKLEIAVADAALNVDDPLLPQLLDLARAMSARFIRVSVPWRPATDGPDPNPMSSWSTEGWDKIDHFIDEAQALGFTIQVTLTGGAATWTGGFGIGLDQPEIAARYIEFVKNRVAHYAARGVKRFSFWNEPNNAPFFASGKYGTTAARLSYLAEWYEQKAYDLMSASTLPTDNSLRIEILMKYFGATNIPSTQLLEDANKATEASRRNGVKGSHIYEMHKQSIFKTNAESYAKLFRRAYREAKRICPGAQFLIGELYPNDAHEFLVEMTRTIRLEADGLALHPYQYTISPLRPDPGNSGGIGRIGEINVLLDSLAKKRRLRTRKGNPLDVYLTEFGYHKRDKRPKLGSKTTKKYRHGKPVTKKVRIWALKQLPERRRALFWRQALDVAHRNGARQLLVYQLLQGGDYKNGKPIDWDTSVVGPKPPASWNGAPYALKPDMSYDWIKTWTTVDHKSWVVE